MSLVGWLRGKGPNGLGYNSTAQEVTAGLSLAGKKVLVTGCTSGLGLETARVLGACGAHVYGTGRTVHKANAALAGYPGTFTSLACELSEPASIRACVQTLRHGNVRLDVVVCNAGIMALPKLQQAHGLELQFFTNHVGHFLLVTSLLDLLADAARVVMLSSEAHRLAPRVGIDFDNLSGARGYRGWVAYGQSKLANILFTKELARRLAGSGKTANAVHPGVIKTQLDRSVVGVTRVLSRALGPILHKTIPQGAATQVYAAVHPAVEGVTGRYFVDCQEAKPRRDAESTPMAQRLWHESERIVTSL